MEDKRFGVKDSFKLNPKNVPAPKRKKGVNNL